MQVDRREVVLGGKQIFSLFNSCGGMFNRCCSSLLFFLAETWLLNALPPSCSCTVQVHNGICVPNALCLKVEDSSCCTFSLNISTRMVIFAKSALKYFVLKRQRWQRVHLRQTSNFPAPCQTFGNFSICPIRTHAVA